MRTDRADCAVAQTSASPQQRIRPLPTCAFSLHSSRDATQRGVWRHTLHSFLLGHRLAILCPTLKRCKPSPAPPALTLPAAVVLPNVSAGAVEQDQEQRRRIRGRVHERMAELGPLLAEVERHVGALGQHVAAAAAGGWAEGSVKDGVREVRVNGWHLGRRRGRT